jgi:hypothetical protein
MNFIYYSDKIPPRYLQQFTLQQIITLPAALPSLQIMDTAGPPITPTFFMVLLSLVSQMPR